MLQQGDGKRPSTEAIGIATAPAILSRSCTLFRLSEVYINAVALFFICSLSLHSCLTASRKISSPGNKTDDQPLSSKLLLLLNVTHTFIDIEIEMKKMRVADLTLHYRPSRLAGNFPVTLHNNYHAWLHSGWSMPVCNQITIFHNNIAYPFLKHACSKNCMRHFIT